MSAPLVPIPRSDLIRSQPEAMRAEQAKADAIIQYAKTMQDWPLLEEAVDAKIGQQREFVLWWDANVGVNHGVGRGHKKISARVSFSLTEAQERTGIRVMQVSRWRKRLQDIPRYRERMLVAARRAAEIAAAANHRAEGTGDNEWFTPGELLRHL